MKMENEVKGLVLRKSDYRDNDAILSVLSNEGKVSILARGINKIKSKNAYGCQLFTYSRFYLLNEKRDSINSLKNVECVNSYRRIREDLVKQSMTFVMMEVLDKMDNDDLTFTLDEVLEYLDCLIKYEDAYCVLSLFLASIANQCGLNPNVDECALCGSSKGISAFSIQDGGFICENCYHIGYHRKMKPDELLKIRAINKAKIEHLPQLMTLGLWNYDIIATQLQLLNEYSGFNVKSAQFLECLESVN